MSFLTNPHRFAKLISSATWSFSDKSADVTLSNGNKTATVLNEEGCVQATHGSFGNSSDKIYWELIVDSAIGDATVIIGIARNSVNLNPGDIRATGVANLWGYRSNGNLYDETTISSLGPGYSNGDRLMFAADLGNDSFWIGVNGSWIQGNPGTGSSPPITSLTGSDFFEPTAWLRSTDSVEAEATVVFSPADFLYSIPSGFSALGV